MEVDSDDEDSDDEQEADETQTQTQAEEEAPGGRGEEPPAQADPTTTEPPTDQPSADGDEGPPPQADGASPEEGSGGPAGELEEQVEPVSPSAGGPGLGPAAAAAQAGEGGGGADGVSQPPRFGPQRMFMDEVVERVCNCDLETEEVQLQVIKALVHACTATTLAVHQASLLTAVKTIYTVSYSSSTVYHIRVLKALIPYWDQPTVPFKGGVM